MIVVVGGQTRNAGKTTAVCEIIGATPEVRWIAVKISRHGHGAELTAPVVVEDVEPSPATDTGRYLAAGAARAFWIRATHEQTMEALALVPPGDSIIESTSVLDFFTPDLFVFVEAPGNLDWKGSALRLAARADVRIAGNAAPAIDALKRRGDNRSRKFGS